MNSWRLTCLASKSDHKWELHREMCKWPVIKGRPSLHSLPCVACPSHTVITTMTTTTASTMTTIATIITATATKSRGRWSRRKSSIHLTLPGFVHAWGLSNSSGTPRAQRTWKWWSMALSSLESSVVKACSSQGLWEQRRHCCPFGVRNKLNA